MSQQLCKQATSAPNAEITLGVVGEFTMRVMKAGPDGQPIESTAREISFPNLITNFGMDSIGSSSSSSADNFWSDCVVGTGNTVPQFTDTVLANQVAASGDGSTTQPGLITRQTSTSPRWIGISRTWRFAAGAAAGNLAEVGIRRQSGSPQHLFSRALIVDGLGNPTTLTVLSDEILDVTYRFRWYIPETDVTGTVTLNGTVHNFTLRPVNIAAAAGGSSGPGWPTTFSGGTSRDGFRAGTTNTGAVNSASTANSVATVGMVAMDALPVLTGIADRGTTAITLPTYTNGTYFRDIVYTWGLTIGNSAGIQLAVLSTGWGSFQIGFSPSFTKLSTQQLRFTLRISWARRP